MCLYEDMGGRGESHEMCEFLRCSAFQQEVGSVALWVSGSVPVESEESTTWKPRDFRITRDSNTLKNNRANKPLKLNSRVLLNSAPHGEAYWVFVLALRFHEALFA